MATTFWKNFSTKLTFERKSTQVSKIFHPKLYEVLCCRDCHGSWVMGPGVHTRKKVGTASESTFAKLNRQRIQDKEVSVYNWRLKEKVHSIPDIYSDLSYFLRGNAMFYRCIAKWVKCKRRTRLANILTFWNKLVGSLESRHKDHLLQVYCQETPWTVFEGLEGSDEPGWTRSCLLGSDLVTTCWVRHRLGWRSPELSSSDLYFMEISRWCLSPT